MPKLGIGKTDRMRKKYNLEPSFSIGSSVASSQLSLASGSGGCGGEGLSAKCGGDGTECCSRKNDNDKEK
jgi:hypothetical protein